MQMLEHVRPHSQRHQLKHFSCHTGTKAGVGGTEMFLEYPSGTRCFKRLESKCVLQWWDWSLLSLISGHGPPREYGRKGPEISLLAESWCGFLKVNSSGRDQPLRLSASTSACGISWWEEPTLELVWYTHLYVTVQLLSWWTRATPYGFTSQPYT